WRDCGRAGRDSHRHSIELYTLFPNTVFVYQADHLEVWRMFPGDRPDRCTVHLALYVPEPAVTQTARRHWTANLQLAIDAVDTEDFRLGEGIQRGFGSGAQDHVPYGRNAPALIHVHRSLRRALGVQGGATIGKTPERASVVQSGARRGDHQRGRGGAPLPRRAGGRGQTSCATRSRWTCWPVPIVAAACAWWLP